MSIKRKFKIHPRPGEHPKSIEQRRDYSTIAMPKGLAEALPRLNDLSRSFFRPLDGTRDIGNDVMPMTHGSSAFRMMNGLPPYNGVVESQCELNLTLNKTLQPNDLIEEKKNVHPWLITNVHAYVTTVPHRTKLTVISDLHLDRFDTHGIEPLQPLYSSPNPEYRSWCRVLALVGDICSPFHPNFYPFMKKVSKNYDFVLYVPGNHEYHANPFPELPLWAFPEMRTMQNINDVINDYITTHFSNVLFMDNRSIIINGYNFIGSTLWSKITTQIDHIRKTVPDYQRIYTEEGVLLTPNDTNRFHMRAVDFIQKELLNSSIPAVILTHHSPLLYSKTTPVVRKNDRKSKNSQAFTTDLSSLIKPPVIFWGFGHTHHSTNFVHNSATMYSNPLGYYNQFTDAKLAKKYMPLEEINFNAAKEFDLDNISPLII